MPPYQLNNADGIYKKVVTRKLMNRILLRRRFVETTDDGQVKSLVMEWDDEIPFVPTEEQLIRVPYDEPTKMTGVYYCFESKSFWLELPDILCEDSPFSLEKWKVMYTQDGWVEADNETKRVPFLE